MTSKAGGLPNVRRPASPDPSRPSWLRCPCERGRPRPTPSTVPPSTHGDSSSGLQHARCGPFREHRFHVGGDRGTADDLHVPALSARSQTAPCAAAQCLTVDEQCRQIPRAHSSGLAISLGDPQRRGERISRVGVAQLRGGDVGQPGDQAMAHRSLAAHQRFPLPGRRQPLGGGQRVEWLSQQEIKLRSHGGHALCDHFHAHTPHTSSTG